jgi:hypothetical protein
LVLQVRPQDAVDAYADALHAPELLDVPGWHDPALLLRWGAARLAVNPTDAGVFLAYSACPSSG